MKWTVDTIIFDFDGTLVNTGKDVANAANYMLRIFGLQELPVETIISYIGGGVEPLVRSSLGEKADDLFNEALPIFKERYKQFCFVETELYPGVRRVIDHFYKLEKKLAIATNKAEHLTNMILEGLDVKNFFRIVVGPDSVANRKPDPESIQKILDSFEIGASDSIIIGDSPSDIQAGKAAGILTCGVTYGYSKTQEIMNANPDLVLHRIDEVMNYLD